MKKRADVGSVLGVFWVHMKRHPRSVFLGVFLTGITFVIDVFVPLYYKKIIDAAAAAPMPTPELVNFLTGLLVMTIGILVVRQLLRRSGSVMASYFQPVIMNELAQSAYSYLMDHSYRFFINNFTGSLVRRINRLVRAFEDFADRLIFDLIPLAVSLTAISVVLYLRDPALGYIFSGWVVLYIAVQIFIARWTLKFNAAVAEKDSEATGVLSDAVSNDVTIKTFAGEDHERSLFKKVSDEQMRLRWKAWGISEAITTAQTVLMIAVEFALFYVAIRLWGEGVLTVGDFVLIQAYLLVAIDRLWNLGGALRKLFESFADATEMVDIMKEPHEIVDAPGAKRLVVSGAAIDFKAVRFGFGEGRPVLDDMDLSIASHEKVALVGPSGAGKTTITKLILRFYDVTKGGIFIDGQDISKVTQRSLREAIAFVPQEPVLFHRTLMENIRYGRRDATDAEVIEAAKKAHCDEFIARTPQGFNTFVGERGIKLSGGERQRIAIARAILKNAPILVLDEATSSLDSESESLIQDAFDKLMEGKTVIAIAHRLSTIMKMDRIIVIEQGKVVTSGTHADLVAHEGGLYKKLWEIQAGGFIEGDLTK